MQLDNYVLCAKSAFVRHGHHMLPNSKTTTARVLKAVALILDIMLSLRFVYDPLSAADNISRQVWPKSGPTKCLNVFIHNKGADKNVRYAG